MTESSHGYSGPVTDRIVAAADGSALGNPGPAGWAWYIDDDHWASGGWDHGTNNMGELMSVLDLLRQTADDPRPLHVLCDSQYAINVISKWSPGWKRKGWRKADGKPVMNRELVQALDEAMQGRQVTFEWVKGHAGHDLNEAADARARAAATAHQQGRSPEPGPGFTAGRVASTAPQQLPTAAPEPEPDLFSFDGSTTVRDDLDIVVELEKQLLDPEVRSDPSQVAALLDPRWSEVAVSGAVWDRARMLSQVGPLPEVPEVDVLQRRWVDDNTILLLWREVGSDPDVMRSSVWVRTNGQWRQTFHQSTAQL